MKILLADSHPEVQSAFRLILERIPLGTQVAQVSEAGSLINLLGQCAQVCPDLILFDVDLVHPARCSQPLAELVGVLRRLCPCARVVAMSSRFEARQAALAAGAGGFISKTDPPDAVLAGIVEILTGSSSSNPSIYPEI